MPSDFKSQMTRLEETFGSRAMPKERAELIWRTVKDMPFAWLVRIVDQMIGDNRQAPLLRDFRDASYRERQSHFKEDVEMASQIWDTGEFNGLPKYLASIGAVSLKNAMEQEKWELRDE